MSTTLSDTLLPKLIGMLVAIVVFAVVLIPIVDSVEQGGRRRNHYLY